MTLFFPRTQEIEGFPVHAELFVADESLQSGVSVTCQAADSGLSANGRSKPECADAVTPSMPRDTENQLGASLPWSLQGNTLVQKVWIVLDREQLHSPLSTLTAKPSNDTNQTGLPLLWTPLLLPLISLHAQQLPSDMVMHPRLHTTF